MKRIIFSAFVLLFVITTNAQSISDARKLTDNEQYDAATEMYKKLITSMLTDATAYYFYGDNLLMSDNPDSAAIIFEKGNTLFPNSPLIKVGNAKLLLNAISLKE